MPAPEGGPRESLIAYDAPLELGPASEVKSTEGGIQAQMQQKLAQVQTDALPEASQILNVMLPCREFESNATRFKQYPSQKKATRLDCIQLQEALAHKLLQRQARETGICPVREELYAQCFDELIRQVTLNDPCRGLLLLRVRDEIRMTIAAYQTLYQSSVTFGTRKQLQAEQGQQDAKIEIKKLEEHKQQLEAQVVELTAKLRATERQHAERKTADTRARQEEMDFLQHQKNHLDQFIKTVNTG